METLKNVSENATALCDKDMYENMKTIDTMIENMTTIALMSAESYGFSGKKILDDVKLLSESTIQNYGILDIENFLEENGHSKDTLSKSYMDSIDHSIPYVEYARNALLELRETALEVESCELSRIDLCREMANSKSEQEKYFHSKEFKEKRMKTLSELQKSAEAEEDSAQKRNALKKLEMIRNSDTLNFLFSRFNEFKEKEIESIAYGFLNGKKFEYIWKKYETNAKRLNILPDTIKRFYNMEETFLHESYHPFNNLFLFIVIRFIAYMDAYNKRDVLYANSLIVKCDHLVYHRFDSTEEEEEFKYVMKTILNNFMTDHYIDLFTKENTTYPLHPVRIAKDEKENQIIFERFMETLKHELNSTDIMQYLNNDVSIDNMKKCLDNMYQEKLNMVKELEENFNHKISIHTPYDDLKKVYDEFTITEETTDNEVNTDIQETQVVESEQTEDLYPLPNND